MMTRLFPVLALAGLLGAPGLAQSQAPASGSRAAALAQLRAEFAATDTNHNGVLSRAEVSARFAHMKIAAADHRLSPEQVKMLTDLWFSRTDKNHDGKITLKESQATMLAVFDHYDTNHDGVLSPAERRAAAERASAIPTPPGVEPGR